MSSNIERLIQDMGEAALRFRRLAANGATGASYAADAIERRIADLKAKLAEGTALAIAARLLDVVPNSKDLDAIGFDLNAYPELATRLDQIDEFAAEISFDYLEE